MTGRGREPANISGFGATGPADADPAGVRLEGSRGARAKERMRKLLLTIGIALGALALAAAQPAPSAEAAARASAASPFIGVSPQTHLKPRDLRLMRRSGVGSLRFPIFWSQTEPEPGAFDWRATDEIVEATARHGFERLPFVWGMPHWVAPPPRGRCRFIPARCSALRLPVRSHAQREAWERFLRALVGRYGPSGEFWQLHPGLPRKPIRSWQIWNEENDHRFAEASVGRYATLLRVSATAIRSVDPGARIVLGGLYAAPKIKPSLDATVFLRQLYRKRGMKKLFDAVALHPYAADPHQMAVHIRALRQVMRRHGEGHKELHVTEFGWGSQTRAAGGNKFERGPAVQALFLERAWRMLLANRRRWNLGAAFWFTWQDVPASSTRCDFCDSNGLLGLNGRPKPALRRFARVARR